jgi:RNA polymerase sigma-70 factor (ECF subfamily)
LDAIDLLRAARKGRPEALLQLFDEHHAPLFRFAYRLTRSAADAEEIVQRCFLELLAPDCAYDPRRASLLSYLFSSVWCLANTHHHRHEAETEALRSELEQAVAGAVMHLPDDERVVLILAHYEKVPLAEIARILGDELPAVKTHLQRARESLKDVLAKPVSRADRNA